MKLSGTITAMITPFVDGKLDEAGFASNVDHQLTNGINGILPLGSTGESATLTPAEQDRVIQIAVAKAKGKVPIWVGTGSNCTWQTIEKTQHAADLGADIALIVTPYYNRPTQEGLFRHFEAIAKEVKIPIFIYNVPGRCGTNIETATLQRIAELPNIVGVKEASGNLYQIGDVLHEIARKKEGFSVLSGDDALTLPMMVLGATGVISVVSNLVPASVVAQVNAAMQGNWQEAKEMHHRLLPLYRAAFLESNPIPIKAAMQLCGMPSGEGRLPLCRMKEENLHILRQVLRQMHLIRT